MGYLSHHRKWGQSGVQKNKQKILHMGISAWNGYELNSSKKSRIIEKLADYEIFKH